MGNGGDHNGSVFNNSSDNVSINRSIPQSVMSTDLPFNAFVNMSPTLDEDEEMIKI